MFLSSIAAVGGFPFIMGTSLSRKPVLPSGSLPTGSSLAIASDRTASSLGSGLT